MKIPPFLFQAEENLVEKTWGGNWIQNLKGLKIDKKIGESWEFSAHPSNPSFVLINKRKVNFIDLIKENKEKILGDIKADTMPILVKLLDITKKISIQVHPSDEVAKMLGEDDRGKDEAWIVIGSGKVYVGFKEDVNPSDLLGESIIEKINRFDAENLDSFKIPAGIIHFAEEVRLLEVSTNSNLTYRIYDFSGRETHFDKALKALRMKKSEVKEIMGEKGRISMDKFEVEVLNVKGEMEIENEVFMILLSLEGSVEIKARDEKAMLERGFSCLIPAITKSYTISGKNNALIAIIRPGRYYL